MNIIGIPLEGAAEIECFPNRDERGWFSRYFCKKELSELSNENEVVQINSSFTSLAGTIRGLHLQNAPYEEDKFVRCISGRIYDVILDVRIGSPTYGSIHSVVLDSEKMNMIFIPKGFAHGFQTLVPNCQILYLHTQFHHPKAEDGFRFDSPELEIDWPLEITQISERDMNLEVFSKEKKVKNNEM